MEEQGACRAPSKRGAADAEAERSVRRFASALCPWVPRRGGGPEEMPECSELLLSSPIFRRLPSCSTRDNRRSAVASESARQHGPGSTVRLMVRTGSSDSPRLQNRSRDRLALGSSRGESLCWSGFVGHKSGPARDSRSKPYRVPLRAFQGCLAPEVSGPRPGDRCAGGLPPTSPAARGSR